MCAGCGAPVYGEDCIESTEAEDHAVMLLCNRMP